MDYNGRVLVLAGPSGVGKTTVMNEVTKRSGEFELVRSATTRQKRNDGNDGEYIYSTKEEFLALCKRGDMLEFTEYGGNFYGTPYSEIERILKSGKTPLLILDINGVRSMKKRKLNFEVYSIYLYAPLETVSERLSTRYINGSEEGAERYVTRMKNNVKDYKNMRLYEELFDIAIPSLLLEETVAEVFLAFAESKKSFNAKDFVKMAENTDFSFS